MKYLLLLESIVVASRTNVASVFCPYLSKPQSHAGPAHWANTSFPRTCSRSFSAGDKRALRICSAASLHQPLSLSLSCTSIRAAWHDISSLCHDSLFPSTQPIHTMSSDSETGNERTPLLPPPRLSQLQHEQDEEASSIVASTVTKEEQRLADSTVGERLPYNDYTTIDWLHDLVNQTKLKSPAPSRTMCAYTT